MTLLVRPALCKAEKMQFYLQPIQWNVQCSKFLPPERSSARIGRRDRNKTLLVDNTLYANKSSTFFEWVFDDAQSD